MCPANLALAQFERKCYSGALERPGQRRLATILKVGQRRQSMVVPSRR